MIKYEIITLINGSWVYLDTYSAEPVDLTFKVTDITDITSVQSSFSKTIKLPETSHNREVLGFTSDLSSDSNIFNPNKKSPCYIIVDTLPQFNGNMQLKKYETNVDKNFTDIEIVIYAENDTLFKNISEKYLSDLDMSSYNHTYNLASITMSWTKDSSHGYFYGLKDLGYNYNYAGLNSTTVRDWKPDIYAIPVFRKILNEAGYSIEGDWINSEEANNLIIPFNQKLLEISPTYSQSFLFRVGLTANQPIKAQIPKTFTSAGNIANYTNYVSGTTSIGSPRIEFTDDFNSPNGDPPNVWSTTLFEYTHPASSSGTDVTRFGGYLKITDTDKGLQPYTNKGEISFIRSGNSTMGFNPFYPKNNSIAFNYSLPFPGYSFGIPYHPDYNSSASYVGTPINTGNTQSRTIQLNFNTEYLDGSNTKRTPLAAGEKVTMVVNRVVVGTYSAGFTFSVIDKSSFISNELYLSAGVNPNQIINMNNVLPKNVKQRDFILWIQKTFNLIFEPSKNIVNTIKIMPYDDYYAEGAIKNWSQKLDISQPVEKQILAETQNKTLIISNAEDKDFYNTDYKSKTNTVYGEFKTEIDNDFLKGTKKIDIGFASTPLVRVPNSNNIVIPTFIKADMTGGFIETKIRLLQKSSTGTIPLTGGDTITIDGNVFTSYPYIGHYNNPYNVTSDLNFGQCNYLYFPQTVVTNNTQFNRYYYKMWSELSDKDSRIIRAKFYLNADDIYNFKFNDKIYLDFEGNGQYYRVNKISGYDPTRIGLCDVELIKIKFFNIPVTKQIFIPLSNPNIAIANMDLSNTSSARTIVTGKNNSSEGDGVLIFGNRNSLTSGNLIVSGNSNRVGSYASASMVIGDDNEIQGGSNNVNVFGNKNIVTFGASNSTVIGDSAFVSSPNTIVLSNTVIFNNNLITAGVDEVLGLYPDNKIINLISAGVDEVRGLGSASIESLISGGVDSVL